MTLLELDGVCVSRSRREVVHDVTLQVDRGEVVAVLGPNGAGKSTLVEAIGGVLRPSAGRVAVDGRVASVLQTPGLARRSVRANVELALAWWGVPRRGRRARALEALDQLRAGHLARRAAGSLSGGERRRVHVARGLALRPDLLLLDEPFAGLDPETRATLCEDTASALRTSAGAVVVVVHERAEAWALADRLVVMTDGRVVADGAPAGLLAAPTHRRGRAVPRLRRRAAPRRRPAPHPAAPRDGRPEGDLAAVVRRVVPLQDGLRVVLETDRGTVAALHPAADLAVGQRVRVTVTGGVRFTAP